MCGKQGNARNAKCSGSSQGLPASAVPTNIMLDKFRGQSEEGANPLNKLRGVFKPPPSPSRILLLCNPCFSQSKPIPYHCSSSQTILTTVLQVMDPYLSTIPDERGEEIKKRVRERDDTETEGIPTKRARSNTEALLSPELGEEDFTNPPKPETNVNGYTRERLQKGLRYINGATKRNITPRTRQFLSLHKDAYKTALESESPSEASRAVVQAMDDVYYSAAFFLNPDSQDHYKRVMRYVKLRRLELLANYGDYLGQELQGIRADLKAAAMGASSDVQNAAQRLGPPNKWTEIARELAEADATDLAQADVKDLRKHVYDACNVLGIDYSHMVWLIKEWGERNRVFHNQIREYISHCHWASLADQISRDLKELPNVAGDEDEAAHYEKVLLHIRDEYFDIIDDDDPEHWFPNTKAKELTTKRSQLHSFRAEK